jgi:RNase P subunit RPR2
VFCIQCANLIQPSDERVRIENYLLHAACAVSYLLQRFPWLGAGR